MSIAAHTRLGTYEVVGPLGSGGMGEVYRAKDLRLGREIAIKVLPSEVVATPDRLARFEREARTVAGLNHPNIVTLHSVEEEGGIRFLTMELVDGQTLSGVVVPGGLPLERVLELAIPLTDALASAHERGVIHRDLKPGNVMVTRDGRVKVLDFGLAKLTGAGADQEATVDVTRAGQVAGTIPYMAPEQLRAETVDARADLFALGIILYELSTGRRPFTGKTSADVGSAILRDPPEPLGRVRADLPAELERIVHGCLEKDPRERSQTALGLHHDLRRLKSLVERGERLERTRTAPDQAASIAVLPFVNRSANAEDEYFSDGLADELIAVLAKIKGLRVSARSSAFRFKGREAPIEEIGQSLNVATVLDGSVRRAGGRVRISVQLVQVDGGDHLWSDTYDRVLDDIFSVQDDIAHSVVKELRARLLGEDAGSNASGEARAEVAHAAKGRTANAEAHRLYLQARHFIERRTVDDTRKGIDYLNDALKLDPEFALAWAELCRAWVAGSNLAMLPTAEGYAHARDAAERALSLEPDLPEGHSARAAIRMGSEWDWRGAASSIHRALELAPQDALVLRRAGTLALYVGPPEEAIRLYRAAVEQDPLGGSSYHNLGVALHRADRLEESEAALRQALELSTQSAGTHGYLAQVLLAQDRHEDALKELALERVPTFIHWAGAMIHHVLGHQEESNAAVRSLVATKDHYLIAEAHAARGETEEAFDALDRAYQWRSSALPAAKFSPVFRPFHADPRWSAFLKKMGLEDDLHTTPVPTKAVPS
jgi:serine/threonine protein kinase/tetratricopeptide (TPR) repeat protein